MFNQLIQKRMMEVLIAALCHLATMMAHDVSELVMGQVDKGALILYFYKLF